MINITVRHNLDRVMRQLDDFAKRQVPFAMSRALNDTAREIQRDIRFEMPRNFKIRRQWVLKGIQVKPSTKRDLRAMVFSKDKFMGRQEYGGDKASRDTRVWRFGNKVAVPLPAAKGGSKSGIVPKRFWPENLPDPFVLKAKDGREYLAIRAKAKRFTGPMLPGKRAAKTDVVLMYVLEDEITVRDRLQMREIGNRVVRDRFDKLFGQALGRALASARR